MPETQVGLTRKPSLTTPHAAAIAGVLFALLYGASLVLIRLSGPDDAAKEEESPCFRGDISHSFDMT